MQAGYEIFFLDESIFSLTSYLTKGWFYVGSRPTKKYVQTPYQRACVFGALNAKGAYTVTKISPKVNSRKYLSFLKRLCKHHPRLCIIVDNATWHTTKAVTKFLKAAAIKCIRLPPYSPELNPIEQYWKNIKQWLATRKWSTLKELLRELKIALRRKSLIPKICKY